MKKLIPKQISLKDAKETDTVINWKLTVITHGAWPWTRKGINFLREMKTTLFLTGYIAYYINARLWETWAIHFDSYEQKLQAFNLR